MGCISLSDEMLKKNIMYIIYFFFQSTSKHSEKSNMGMRGADKERFDCPICNQKFEKDQIEVSKLNIAKVLIVRFLTLQTDRL